MAREGLPGDFAQTYTTTFIRPESRTSFQIHALQNNRGSFAVLFHIDSSQVSFHTDEPLALATLLMKAAAELQLQVVVEEAREREAVAA